MWLLWTWLLMVHVVVVVDVFVGCCGCFVGCCVGHEDVHVNV